MANFVVFAGDKYYPCGGWKDMVARFGSKEAAVYWLTHHENNFDWWQIVDLVAFECVEEGRK